MLMVSILGETAAKTEKTALLNVIGQKDRQADRQTHRHRHVLRKAGRQTDRQTQTDRETDRRVLTTVSPVCRFGGSLWRHNVQHYDLRDHHGFLQKQGLFLCLSLSLPLSDVSL